MKRGGAVSNVHLAEQDDYGVAQDDYKKGL